jgi:hypothetical protein
VRCVGPPLPPVSLSDEQQRAAYVSEMQKRFERARKHLFDGSSPRQFDDMKSAESACKYVLSDRSLLRSAFTLVLSLLDRAFGTEMGYPMILGGSWPTGRTMRCHCYGKPSRTGEGKRDKTSKKTQCEYTLTICRADAARHDDAVDGAHASAERNCFVVVGTNSEKGRAPVV